MPHSSIFPVDHLQKLAKDKDLPKKKNTAQEKGHFLSLNCAVINIPYLVEGNVWVWVFTKVHIKQAGNVWSSGWRRENVYVLLVDNYQLVAPSQRLDLPQNKRNGLLIINIRPFWFKPMPIVYT